MKIIIEGCDGVGKSEICKELKLWTGGSVVHLDENINDYRCFVDLASVDNIIFDRQIISEVVYSKVFGRKQNISFEDLHIFLYNYRKAGGKVFIIDRELDEIEKALKERNEDFDYVKMMQIRELYLDIARLFDIPVVKNKDIKIPEIAEEIYNESTNF